MKRALLISVLINGLLFPAAVAQVKDATINLQQQAEIMGAAYLKEDYKTFVDYTYPGVIKLTGGADKMIPLLKQAGNEMKKNRMTVSKISFDKPSTLIKEGNELQATIKQHLELKLPGEKLVTTSTLIAISANNGNNWTFLSTTNKDAAALRKTFPNISKQINIPPQQPPVRSPVE